MPSINRNLFATAIAATVVLSTGVANAADQRVRNVVLVHGAFADGSGWKAVSDLLAKDGFKVSIVQEPETSLQDDIDATRRVLDQQDGPTVLVGHSYGGMVITDAGNDPKVKSLVYVSAFMPEVGDSLLSLAKTMPLPNQDIKATKDGYLYLEPGKFAADFSADLPRKTSEFLAKSQVFASEKAFAGTTSRAAWHDKPSFAIISTQDKAINPDLERWMYKRGGAKVTEIKSSHAVYMSNPKTVVAVIEAASRAGE